MKIFLSLSAIAVVLTSETLTSSGPPEKSTAAASRSLVQMREALEKGDWARSEFHFKNLIGNGPEIIPMLRAELGKNEGSREYRAHLVNTLARIKGEKQSTEALLDVTLTHPDAEVRTQAGMWIDNRVIETFLTKDQISRLVSRIDSENGEIAAQWAYALARAKHVDDGDIVQPLIRRFKLAIQTVKEKPGRYYPGSYTTDEVVYLNRFLRAFPFIESNVAVPVLRKEIAQAPESRLKLWLTIAAGMSGDETLAIDLLKVVESELEDSSVRAVALRAYARSLKQGAIPVLERFRHDRTPGPNPRYPPIATIAHDELATLQANGAEK